MSVYNKYFLLTNDSGGKVFSDSKNIPILNSLTGYQLSRLHTFECVARRLSFALAAEELFVSPSAVSHRISQLEKELGFSLFYRLHRKIALTPEGERMQWALKNSFNLLNQEVNYIRNSGLTGDLTVYSHPSIVQCLLLPHLNKFIEQNPAVQLKILTGLEAINLANRGVDLAIYFGKPSFSESYTEEIFMKEAITPVCTPRYARNHGLYNNPEKLSDCIFLHDRFNSGENEWANWTSFFQLDIDTDLKGISFDRSDLALIAASRHLGIAMGRINLVQEWTERGELIFPFPGMLMPVEHCYFNCIISDRQWPKIMAFKRFLSCLPDVY